MSRLIGHIRVRRLLEKRLSKGQWPQVLLLSGPAGIGKGLLSRSLAKRSLCREDTESPTVDGCGTCTSCVQFDRGSHPDVYILEPGGRRASISVDDVRALADWEPIKPVYRAGKVIIVDPADALSESAQNALLKILEEPSPGTRFFLSCVDTERLLPTVLNRAVHLPCRELPEEDLVAIARAHGWGEPDSVLCHLSLGSARNLMWLMHWTLQEFTETFLENLARIDPIDGIEFSRDILRHRKQLEANADSFEDEGERAEVFSEAEYVFWILSLLEGLIEDGSRLAQGLSTRIFTGHERAVTLLMAPTTHNHRWNMVRKLIDCRRDLRLHLDPPSVLADALRQFLEERYIQEA